MPRALNTGPGESSHQYIMTLLEFNIDPGLETRKYDDIPLSLDSCQPQNYKAGECLNYP